MKSQTIIQKSAANGVKLLGKFFLLFILMLCVTPAFSHNGGNFNPGLLIPVTAIIFIFGGPIVLLSIYFYFRYKANKKRAEVIEKAILAGQPIPNELFKEQTRAPRNYLGEGITMIGAGIGIGIMLWILVAPKFASIGLLVLLIGIAELVIHQIQKKDKNSETTPSSKENNVAE